MRRCPSRPLATRFRAYSSPSRPTFHFQTPPVEATSEREGRALSDRDGGDPSILSNPLHPRMLFNGGREDVARLAGAERPANRHRRSVRIMVKPRPEDVSGRLPAVHPGAELPPVSKPARPKFSFVRDPSLHRERDHFVHSEVPNNTPKPLLPMWASSLTSPALGKQRLVEETWVSSDARGTVDAAETEAFVQWLQHTMLPSNAPLIDELRDNVILSLRQAYRRGLYAKRDFAEGEVILTIPLAVIPSETDNGESVVAELEPARCLTLNTETLSTYSSAARRRGVPAFETVRAALTGRPSDTFHLAPHALFVDQVLLALYLACEKADGPDSSFFPYIRLLGDSYVDDDHICELHKDVLDPVSLLEFRQHRSRFEHYARMLHQRWLEAYEKTQPEGELQQNSDDVFETVFRATPCTVPITAAPLAHSFHDDRQVPPGYGSGRAVSSAASPDARAVENASPEADAAGSRQVASARKTQPSGETLHPPPSMEDILWALRVVLSRQWMLPGIRQHREQLLADCTVEARQKMEMDAFARGVMRMKWFLYDKVFNAIDECRLRANDFDPTTMATLVPLLDMMQHDPCGKANTTFTIENCSPSWPMEKGDTAAEPCNSTPGARSTPGKGRAGGAKHVVVRATEPIEMYDELTTCFPRCYSVAYTLYRFGFLPLRSREDDYAECLAANGLDGTGRVVPAVRDNTLSNTTSGNQQFHWLKKWWRAQLS